MSIDNRSSLARRLVALGFLLVTANAVAQPAVTLAAGRANVIDFFHPSPPTDGSICNVEFTFPDGKKLEAELAAPQYGTQFTHTPPQPGVETVTWQGKAKFRGLNSRAACPGSGSLTLAAVAGRAAARAKGAPQASAPPVQAQAPAYVPPPVPPRQWIKLTNLASGFCLDTDGQSVNGGSVRMWNCVNHPNQIWTMISVGPSHRLMNRNSNFCLDSDGTQVNRGQVRMWACSNHPNQLWDVQQLASGSYRLVNRASGLCLDTDGRSVNGGEARMWNCSNHLNQSWR